MTPGAENSKIPSAPPRLTGRPTRDEAEALTDRLLDTAERLFKRDGFAATSIEAVAAEAGLNKRTIYRRVTDKAGLFEAVVRRHLARRGMATPPPRPKGDLHDQLTSVAEAMLERLLSPESIAMRRTILAQAAAFPHFARQIADPTLARRMIESLLVADKPGLAPETLRQAAANFVALVIAEPLVTALHSPASESGSAHDRTRTRQSVEFFMLGWKATTRI